MSNGLIILIYTIAAYGISNMMVFGEGPARLFEYIREWAYMLGENFGNLFQCMMCLPANVGIVCSLINWFFIPVAITPFNIILQGNPNLWWIAMIGDCVFTSGAVWLIHHFEEFFENIAEGKTGVIESNNDDDVEG